MTLHYFVMEDIGEGLDEVEVITWLAEVGDTVTADEPVVVVETAKAQVELPAPVTGVLAERLFEPGEVARIGSRLFAVKGDSSAPRPAPAEPSAPADAAHRTARPTLASIDATQPRVLAAPAARRLAYEHDIPLDQIAGTGPNGRINLEDVERHLARDKSKTPPAAGETEVADVAVPLRGVRRTTAARMTAATTIPHIYEFADVDATELERTRDLINADVGPDRRVTTFALLTRLTASALARRPDCNSHFDPVAHEVTPRAAVDLSIAVATAHGLIVPVLRNAQRPVLDVADELTRLSQAARDRSLAPEDVAGGTCTLSNFGANGTVWGTPMITPPQVCVVGFGRIREMPVVDQGAVVVKRMLPLAVAVDHRVLDGADLAAFVATLSHLITHPVLQIAEEPHGRR